jgi:hypothetical protein
MKLRVDEGQDQILTAWAKSCPGGIIRTTRTGGKYLDHLPLERQGRIMCREG